MRVAVVGGGLSGLSAAHFLRRAGHQVVCFEPGAPGGVIGSERRQGFLCERGPQALVAGPEVQDLLEGAGLLDRVVEGSPATRRRFIYIRGAMREVPASPLGLLTSNLLPWGAKLSLMGEPFRRRPTVGSEGGEPAEGTDGPVADESILSFGRRRLGAGAAATLLGPAVIGVYGGDAAQLSAPSALPRLWTLEQQHGSLLRGLLRAQKDARRAREAAAREGRKLMSGLVSFDEGLAVLPAALAQGLGDGLRPYRVRGFEPEGGGGWRVHWSSSSGGTVSGSDQVDRVVLAVPTRAAAALLAPLAPAAAQALEAIPLAPLVVVCLGFLPDAQGQSPPLGMDLAAYGFLVARGEEPTLLGCQYESSVFPGRAPPGGVLLRVLLGGVFEPDLVEADDSALIEKALGDLRTSAGLQREPDMAVVFRHRAAIPQYVVGHGGRVRALDQALRGLPGLSVVGYGVRGVGLSDCIRTGRALAESLSDPPQAAA